MSDGAGWLQISTSGFASFNKSRPPGHLVKELVQNAFDAIGDRPGGVRLDYRHENNCFVVECYDNGSGLDDLDVMRVVYLTFKTDSHLKRGRFGRGFKEILSVAEIATVVSGNNSIEFLIENGEQVTRSGPASQPVNGTLVKMKFPWPQETVTEFDLYFSQFLVPVNIQFLLNGKMVLSREISHAVEAMLPTEIYNPDSHSWKKPRRKTIVELVEIAADEEPCIYEMGIPVAVAEWSAPYHANVRQRVPMNPNRDALASGYSKNIHTACLPILLPELTAEETTADWVGTAGMNCDENVQKGILNKAFGDNAVRSVPSMGKRDYDHDAERTGAAILKTSQMSSGFREMAKVHLDSAKDRVDEVHLERAKAVTQNSFNPNDAMSEEDERRMWIERRGGLAQVDACLSFAVWFCQQLVNSTDDPGRMVTGNLALGNKPELFGVEISTFLAHWSDTNVLTLALETNCFWECPMGAEALSILVHEAAHGRNLHHGKGFHDEVERLAGVAAEVMFENADNIRGQWQGLV